MKREETFQAAEEMLRDLSAFSSTLGGIEFYGCSTELCDLIHLCREFASIHEDVVPTASKAYVFIERYHGKTSLAKATDVAAKDNGVSAYLLDGTAGTTLNELRVLQPLVQAVILVDGLPEAAANRRVLLERFNALTGRALLFAPPAYFADAYLNPGLAKLRLTHIDERPIDKLAWLIGIVRENLRDDAGLVPEVLSRALAQLPARALATFSNATLGPRVRDLTSLARRIAEALRLKVELEPAEAFSSEELAAIFMDFYSSTECGFDYGFRLWVEGDSDCRMFKIVSRLAKEAQGTDLEGGLFILPLGAGREGGTSKAPDVVFSERTRKNRDVFLLDFDESGRHAREELQILGQDVILLDPKLSCSRSDEDAEIEDFVSLSCLDRFYEAHSDLRPEKEVLRYKAPSSRRLVVDGAHKEKLIDWLESNASLDDVENLFFIFCEVRERFSLRNPLSTTEMRVWKKRLQDEFNPDKHLGTHPAHWLL